MLLLVFVADTEVIEKNNVEVFNTHDFKGYFFTLKIQNSPFKHRFYCLYRLKEQMDKVL